MSSKKYRNIIFDLDGTLVDSLTDIANTMNSILKANNLSEHGLEKYRNFIGSGLNQLILQAIGKDLSDSEVASLRKDFDLEYDKKWDENLEVFDKCIDTLEYLYANEFRMFILSNKPHSFVPRFIEAAFPKNFFIESVGINSPDDRKPNPKLLEELLKKHKLDRSRTLFVGDGETDVKVGKNANLDVAWISWGYRDFEQIKSLDPEYCVNSFEELLELLYE